MIFFVAVYLTLFDPPSHHAIAAFRDTAPQFLTNEDAAWHLIGARAAGIVHRVRPELLLSIAHHESRYVTTTRTHEPGHRVSCGVMTPVPQRRCTEYELTLLGGYDRGAAHLREWLDHYEDHEVPALIAYVGGSGLVTVCRRSGVWKTPRGTNACDVVYEFRRHAKIIERALHHGQQN